MGSSRKKVKFERDQIYNIARRHSRKIDHRTAYRNGSLIGRSSESFFLLLKDRWRRNDQATHPARPAGVFRLTHSTEISGRFLRCSAPSAESGSSSLAQQVRSKIAIVVFKRPVRVVPLRGKKCPHFILRRREHQQIPLGIELTAGRLHHAFAHHLASFEIDGAGRR